MSTSIFLNVVVLVVLSTCASLPSFTPRPGDPEFYAVGSTLSQADHDSIIAVGRAYLKLVGQKWSHISRIDVVRPTEALASVDEPSIYYIVIEKVGGTWRAMRIKRQDPRDIVL
jgi:uncharacterized protein YceK